VSEQRRPTWRDGVDAMRDHIEVSHSRHMRWGPFSWWTTITQGVTRVGEGGGFHTWTLRGAKRRATRTARQLRREEQAYRDAIRWRA
jgi:hypothetical protein